jgi:lipoprotein-anchoring transpeptidase ErfK/SrfK
MSNVGNDFMMPQPHLETPETNQPIVVESEQPPLMVVSLFRYLKRQLIQPRRPAFYAIIFLVVTGITVQVAGHYWSSHITDNAKPVATAKAASKSIIGLNVTIPSDQLEAKLQPVISQPVTLTVGDQTKTLSADTIRSWLQITPDKHKAVTYVHVGSAAITASLNQLANRYVKSPVNQVTVTHPDGSGGIIVAGRSGTKLTDPGSLAVQAKQIAKTVMDGKGMQFSTPLETMPFQSVTPSAFNKLIEVNVVSKQMYLYDNGQLTHSYPISAGAPKTPTPIGQFRIYAKFSTQDMKGFNADGSKYLQPHVHWINYFLPGGYAVHGNYWRPLSWFGAINSSHGCVSLPDSQAKEVYDWAPIGTTVITHY